MKNIALIISLVLLLQGINAQKKISKEYQWKNGQKLKLDMELVDSIVIKTWDKNSIKVDMEINVNDNKNNDAFKYSESISNSRIFLEGELNTKTIRKKKIVKKKLKDGTTITTNNWIETDISCIVYMPKNCDLAVNSICADIELDGLTADTHIKTISGLIDISLDKNLNADLDIKTISGEVYTDLEFEKDKGRDYNSVVGVDMSTRLNKGGHNIDLESISGNIYIRKK